MMDRLQRRSRASAAPALSAPSIRWTVQSLKIIDLEGRGEGADRGPREYSLRNIEGCRVTAHLLVPGLTFSIGMTARGRTWKPPGSWTPDQVMDVPVERIGKGDF